MNITYLIGTILASGIMIAGMMFGVDAVDPTKFAMLPGQLTNFFDPASILITIGCTLAVIIASFPGGMLKHIPSHFKILFNVKRYDPTSYIEQLVELAQVARKSGLLALEEIARQQKDPFFKQCIVLLVDNNDASQNREIMMNDIEQSSGRHDGVAAMYEKGSSVAPAFGMVGTLVGLINMLKSMDMSSGSSDGIGPAMGTALITTLYGCIMAHVLFGPIASNLRTRDEEEVLCKLIIVEGIMSIQSGANPKFLREKLMTFMGEQQRNRDKAEGGKRSKGKKK